MTSHPRKPPGRGALVLLFAVLFFLPARVSAHEGADERLAALDREIAGAPDSAALYLERGERRRLRGEWDLAAADYDRAAALEPDLPAIDLCRGALLLDRGRPPAAREALARFLARSPSDARALWLSGRAEAASGRPLLAAARMEQALERAAPRRPEQYLEWARTLAAAGPEHRGRAVAALDRGIARLGAAPALVEEAVRLECEAGSTDAALARIERHARAFGHPLAALVRRGEVLALAGRDLESRAAFSEALALLEDLPPEQRAAVRFHDLERRLDRSLSTAEPARRDP